MAKRTWKKDATVGDLYGGIFEVTTEEEASEYLEALVEREVEYFGKSREEARQVHSVNIGYWSGYGSSEGMARVQRLFKCAHPISGSSSPTPKEAFETGKRGK